MSQILHLNLHREFFAAIANKQKRVECGRHHATGASGWKNENMTRSYSATAMRKTHLKCWWNFEVCAAMAKVAVLTTPSASDAY